jgi:soluble lytic murein transglycosylase-like protein
VSPILLNVMSAPASVRTLPVHPVLTGHRVLALVLGVWALSAVACATTPAPHGRSPQAAAATYGAPRVPERFAVAPPLAPATAPEAAPILDEAPAAEHASLFLAREILNARAVELDPLQVEGVARAVAKAEQEHGLPALLVLALIEQESQFRPKARGPGGSLGLMQLMPTAARTVAAEHDIPWQGTHTLHDPVKNVHLGVLYLAKMRDLFGSVDLAMAAYNIGPGAVQRRLARGKSCKGPYVRGVLQRYQSLRLVFGDPTTAIGG